MKALVYTGPEQMEMRDVPMPEATNDLALIAVDHVGICGSDMHGFLGHDERRPAPLILGHEAAGMVIEGPMAGTRVTINPLVTNPNSPDSLRGRENLCPERQIISMPPREGAFASHLTMPERNLVPVPDDVPLAKAALAEPLACGWHAVRLGRAVLDIPEAQAKALVIGGGAIGLGSALCLAAQGVDDITLVEPNGTRAAYLRETCGIHVVAPDDLDAEQLFDLVVDGVGYAGTRASATAHTRPGGVIVHIGLGSGESGLDIRRMTLQEITFIGTYAYTAQDFRDTAEAIFAGKLGALDWTETRPLDEGAQAFADIRAGVVAAPKVLLRP
ncbi:MAG: alcohol dehydrogenase catalytic domain-containing protein [Pseudomonadota bacterium]